MDRPDFSKLEDLRKHMMLSVSDVAKLYGVSRTTYYGWMKGKPMRKRSQDRVNMIVRYLLDILVTHDWPSAEHRVLTAKSRFAALCDLIKELHHASLKKQNQ